jgi:hypothetical protein
MAKKSKERIYKDIDAGSGLGTLSVNVGTSEKPVFTAVKGVSTTPQSFAALVASALKNFDPKSEDVQQLSNLFSIYTRGVESATRVNYKSKHNTRVSLGGGKYVDLMMLAEKKGVNIVTALINSRFDQLATLQSLDIDAEKKLSPEDLAAQKTAIRKREAGWFNSADALVAQGKAKMENGKLVAA